jgi:RHS repeat-associated protein
MLSGHYSACTNYTLDVSHVSGDANTYETVTSVDPNDHVAISSLDALGRTRYLQIDSGVHSNPSTLMGNERKSYQYNVLGEATSVSDTDLAPQTNETLTSVTTTASYDSLGRMTQLVDPERGTHNYTYDADSRLLSDVSGARTIGYSYDLLGRVGCIQDQSPTLSASGACSSGANPFVQNTYDTNILGTQGSTDFPIGRLTQTRATNYFPGPDYTQGYVSEQMQYDQRGRLTNETLQISASGGSLTFPSFPTYQLSQSYNDADQPTTTTTSSNPSGLGYSFTNFYDSATGVLVGLGSTTSSANLATLSYNLNALPSTISFQSSASTALAQEQFSYDNNLRPTQTTATWLSGSGTSGTIYSQSLGYDAASNVTSSTTVQAVVSGANNSGGSETEIYCYDEQNRLVWAGNYGTPQGASNGTCGTGMPSNSLSGATYSNQYVYTHLGQLWQGPYNGAGSYQYLYCNSSEPHQLTGLYPSGTTCSTTGGKTQTYGASYDSRGNMTTRTASGSGGTTATLSYDGQDHLVRWNDTNTTTNEEWYLYDASGQRVLRRSQTGTGNSNTKYTLTAFSLEDHIYDGGGNNLNNKYYYYLAGRLIGLNNGSPNFLFTDALGSVVSSITNTANSASVKGNQVYGPYGNNPYSKGTMGTTKGYTGQYNDSLTQLDYYGARYYDPLVGVFLSADSVQGNLQGMDPYGYVAANPETNTDPSGSFVIPSVEGAGGMGLTTLEIETEEAATQASLKALTKELEGPMGSPVTAGNTTYSYDPVSGDLSVKGGQWQAVYLAGDFSPAANAAFQTYYNLTNITPPPALNSLTFAPYEHPVAPPTQPHGGGQQPPVGPPAPPAAPAPCSFTPSTEVTTAQGKEPIGKLHVGDKVLAYNPKTHKMELQPVLHVWKHTDSDLVDLTITTVTTAQHGHKVVRQSEIVHTTSEHPFFTKEQGFVPAGKLQPGMHLLGADGRSGVVTSWKAVHATKVMYNLEVAQDHTFVVGHGQWVVHNECNSGPLRRALGLPPNNQLPYPVQAQHITPCQTSSGGSLTHDLVTLAEQGPEGTNFLNGAWNGIALPSSMAGSNAMNLPQHLGRHNAYTSQILQLLDIEWGRLTAAYPGGFTYVKAQAGVKRVSAWARSKIIGAGGNCTINGVDLDVGNY